MKDFDLLKNRDTVCRGGELKSKIDFISEKIDNIIIMIEEIKTLVKEQKKEEI
jgi:hypothetical protein